MYLCPWSRGIYADFFHTMWAGRLIMQKLRFANKLTEGCFDNRADCFDIFLPLDDFLVTQFNLLIILSLVCYLCLHAGFPMPVMSMTTMAISLERSHSATATAPFHLLPSRSWTAFKVIIIWSISILITLPAAVINIFDSNATYMSPRKCKRVRLWKCSWTV